MYYEMWIELAGELQASPEFKQDGKERLFVEFYVHTNNQTITDKKVRSFRCFAWEGELFRQLKVFKLERGDNVLVKGLFSIHDFEKLWNKKNGTVVEKQYYELRVYAKYIKVIEKASYQENLTKALAKTQMVDAAILGNDKRVEENEYVEMNISDNDKPF